MSLVHHMRGEPRLLEQLDELSRAVGTQRMVGDGSGQHAFAKTLEEQEANRVKYGNR